MEYFRELRKLVGTRPLILPGAVVLIINGQDEVMLQLRTDGGWGLPGGLMELGESLEDTARREVAEETGLEIGELKLVNVFSGPEYYLKVANGDELYAVTAVYSTEEFEGEIVLDPAESADLKFFAFDQLPADLKETYYEFMQAYSNQQQKQHNQLRDR